MHILKSPLDYDRHVKNLWNTKHFNFLLWLLLTDGSGRWTHPSQHQPWKTLTLAGECVTGNTLTPPEEHTRRLTTAREQVTQSSTARTRFKRNWAGSLSEAGHWSEFAAW